MALPKEVSDAVVQDPDVESKYHGTWGFVCPRPNGCVPFSSLGWPTKADAAERLRQHLDEHETKVPMSETADFMAERGLTTHPETGLAVKA